MSELKQKTCDECKHCFDDRCRRFPPVAVLDPSHGGALSAKWAWPLLGINHSACGEFDQRMTKIAHGPEF